MPICVHCNSLAEYVYTVYSSRDNIRLAVCSQCGLFVDPLVEHPLVLLLIDVILLKPRVYRHLVFNYGSEPLQAGRKPVAVPEANQGRVTISSGDGGLSGKQTRGLDERTRVATANHDRSKIILYSILWMAAITISVESLVLYSTISAASTDGICYGQSSGNLAICATAERRKWLGSIVIVVLSTAVQHLATTVIAAGFLKLGYSAWLLSRQEKLAVIVDGSDGKELSDVPKQDLDKCESCLPFPSDERSDRTRSALTQDGRGLYFVWQMVSLTLFFTSLLPCILHICLFIWTPATVGDSTEQIINISSGRAHESATNRIKQHAYQAILAPLVHAAGRFSPTFADELQHFWQTSITAMKREGMDEMWIAVRLLAGMSSGFGLRVIMPNPPWQTSLAVLGGWLAKTVIQTVLYTYLF